MALTGILLLLQAAVNMRKLPHVPCLHILSVYSSVMLICTHGTLHTSHELCQMRIMPWLTTYACAYNVFIACCSLLHSVHAFTRLHSAGMFLLKEPLA